MRFLLKPLNKLRRVIIQLIDKNYIKDKLKKRKGKCKKCGQCCKGCKYLNKRTRLCKTYSDRPWTCYKEFPLDKIDQWIWDVKNCGYKFK
ncbi:MAG: YkgJ family cysteine cluster protein [Candidatus Pacearchaeota archaeon]